MTKRWLFRALPEVSQVTDLADALSISPKLATLLVQKGITSFDQAKDYFRPSLAALHDPWTMQGMERAVARLALALERQERIVVYGDYDVDGVTSVALCYDFLRKQGAHVQFYIPDRYTEGYGISPQGVQWAAQAGAKLLISLDCGIKALHSIQEARAQGIDVIVCDHHEPGPVLPEAYAILDPKQPTCPYPAKELSGCGVGFKLLQALTLQQQWSVEKLYQYLDLVAISIACDIVPIVGENRILAYHGLKQLNDTPRPGLQALIEQGNLRMPLDIRQLVFGLGPRINAAGRIDHARLAVDLLLATAPAETEALASTIDQKNRQRKDFDSTTTEEALAMIKACPRQTQAKTTVLFKENWHKGVVGIVASRCIEQYYRPTVILTAARGKATGSARSVVGYNVYEALHACADLLEQYGGHAYAAGLTLPLEHVPAFQQRFEEVVTKSIDHELLTPPQEIDLPLALEEIDDKFYNILRQMAPFGTGNMRTVFSSEGVVAQRYSLLKEQHLKLSVKKPGTHQALDAIGFGLAHCEPFVRAQRPFKMIYTIEENTYWGAPSLQLNVKDIQPMASALK